jgi:murein DD-endopeptidase MepM/ murein hydrolase activator NlpD
MAEPRTFKVDSPHQRGPDVESWQEWLRMTFRRWDIAYPIQVDGVYDVATRAATASMCEALGLVSPYGMENGVTPELRTKLRHRRLTAAERARYLGSRVAYRRKLRRRFESGDKVHTPLARILDDRWGYHPPRHDGLDLICPAKATLFAICDGEVIRADPDGWWGKGAPDPQMAAKGDGIIVIRCSTDVGPFRRGLNFGYGHAEAPTVRVGEKVKAGERIGRAGFANAWHIHMVVNGRSDAKGVGDRDPRPFVDYARART